MTAEQVRVHLRTHFPYRRPVGYDEWNDLEKLLSGTFSQPAVDFDFNDHVYVLHTEHDWVVFSDDNMNLTLWSRTPEVFAYLTLVSM